METADDTHIDYEVVMNKEEQYSICRLHGTCHSSGRASASAAPRAECLEHISKVWTDMRPLSLRALWRRARPPSSVGHRGMS
jgi:MbtH protein